jgi:hypothetical protein
MNPRITALQKQLNALKRDFREHKHTGLDSKVIDLSTQIQVLGSLSPADNSAVDTTYGAEEAAVIENLRARVAQLETVLQAFGILS